jgi:RluA family pseudouridine synthase
MTDTLPVLFDNGSLVAFDKPAGLSSIRGRGDKGLSLHERMSQAEERPLFIAHRLDKDTSGVIVFARDADAHRRLNQLFEQRQVKKLYLAWVLGRPAEDSGTVEAPLREFGSGRAAVDPRGKPAVTRWKVLRREKDRSLLEVAPETGRRHQIRAHLYSIGHPVLGDRMYGSPRPVGGAPRLLLHARELLIPWDGPEPLRILAPIPPDFPF